MSLRFSLRRAAMASLCIMVCAFTPHAAFAGRPMVTDDATIVDDKSCQIEAWMEGTSNRFTYWMLPACNFTGNLELTIGGAWTHENGSTRNTQVALQGKTVLKSLRPNDWGLGLAAGTLWHAEGTSNRRSYRPYAYLPASFSFYDDRIIAHANMGWEYDSGERANHFTWGVATEVEIVKPVSAFAEIFGKERDRPSFQFGLWYWIVRDRVQVNAAYANRFGTPPGEYLFTVGINLFSPPFLPEIRTQKSENK